MSTLPMAQADAYRMVARQAAAAGIGPSSKTTPSATRITAYFKNGGVLDRVII